MNPVRFFLTASILVAISSLDSAAATITLTASDASGTSSFASSLHWSDGLAPSPANDYLVAGGLALRSVPNGGDATFAGNSLTIGGGATTGAFVLKNALGATVTVNNLTLNNGEVSNSGGGTGSGTANGIMTLAGDVTLASGSTNRLNANAVGRTLIVSAPISGSGSLSIIGAGLVTLSGNNTYTGNTTITAGTFSLANTGQLQFVIGASGINNTVLGTVGGTESFTIDGTFNFDLSGATASPTDSWSIVDVTNMTAAFGSSFAVTGFTQQPDNTTWTNGTYQFSETTGNLTVVPEPAALSALLGGTGVLFGLRRRRA